MPRSFTKTIVAAVADYFIYLGSKDKTKAVSNKKLQKLVYYSQAWSLVLNNKILFDDKIEAWIHGPVIPILYKKYKKFGFQHLSMNDHNYKPEKKIPKDILNLLNEVWRIYGKYDADYLELLTHEEDPWIITRNNIDPKVISSKTIPVDLMKIFYTSLLIKVKQQNVKKNRKAKIPNNASKSKKPGLIPSNVALIGDKNPNYVITFKKYNDKICQINDLIKNSPKECLHVFKRITHLLVGQLQENNIGKIPISKKGGYKILFNGLDEDVDLYEHKIQGTARLFYFTAAHEFCVVAITANHLETNKNR
ncbi:MAG: hypothetical protein K1060chlam4_00611 [Candidatus Anoxychlamydiales bacterium]|nr:hypothetical protein [Candidatus Anoxychlamydiales bacterium]